MVLQGRIILYENVRIFLFIINEWKCMKFIYEKFKDMKLTADKILHEIIYNNKNSSSGIIYMTSQVGCYQKLENLEKINGKWWKMQISDRGQREAILSKTMMIMTPWGVKAVITNTEYAGGIFCEIIFLMFFIS